MAILRRVDSFEACAEIAALARRVWTQHYTALIGAAQVEYMLARFQSADAVSAQCAQGFQYYQAEAEEGVPAGYVALVPQPAECRMLLSKIYVLAEWQGRGLGAALVAFAEARCRALGLETLWLTVNRHNHGSIVFYRRAGFTVEAETVSDIGGGFVMDDWRMAKRVLR